MGDIVEKTQQSTLIALLSYNEMEKLRRNNRIRLQGQLTEIQRMFLKN